MKSSILQLYACYEGRPHDGILSPFHRLYAFHRLYGGMTDQECLNYFIAQFEYGGDAEETADVKTMVDDLEGRDTALLAGGLVAIKGDFKLFPSCCCGIEAWREWWGATYNKGGRSLVGA